MCFFVFDVFGHERELSTHRTQKRILKGEAGWWWKFPEWSRWVELVSWAGVERKSGGGE